MKTDILICECNSIEHQIIVSLDENESIVYFEIHLITHRNIFKRLWVALKYIFGYKCNYGNWDEFILNDSHSDIIWKILEHINKKFYKCDRCGTLGYGESNLQINEIPPVCVTEFYGRTSGICGGNFVEISKREYLTSLKHTPNKTIN